uniref:Uncharacterized protein n=1 Tax=Anguilla anguilla TaxID=7936 RepID=A0A0E9UYR9_ANGAN
MAPMHSGVAWFSTPMTAMSQTLFWQ